MGIVLVGMLSAGNLQEAAGKLDAEMSYSDAVMKAEAEKKTIVMVIVKPHCRWCHRLVNETLNDPEVRKVLKNYILLIVGKSEHFPKAFSASLFPSIFYIDYCSKQSLYENVGYVGKEAFLNDLHESIRIRKALYSDTGECPHGGKAEN